MKKIIVLTISVLALLSRLGFSSNYNLYSEASKKSDVLSTIDDSNHNEYIRFYTDEEGKWAKYANTYTGKTGWVDLSEVEKEKENYLRKEILKEVDKEISYYNKKISELSALKNNVSRASYKDLQKNLLVMNNTKGIMEFSNSWVDGYGKIHKNSGYYCL